MSSASGDSIRGDNFRSVKRPIIGGLIGIVAAMLASFVLMGYVVTRIDATVNAIIHEREPSVLLLMDLIEDLSFSASRLSSHLLTSAPEDRTAFEEGLIHFSADLKHIESEIARNAFDLNGSELQAVNSEFLALRDEARVILADSDRFAAMALGRDTSGRRDVLNRVLRKRVDSIRQRLQGMAAQQIDASHIEGAELAHEIHDIRLVSLVLLLVIAVATFGAAIWLVARILPPMRDLVAAAESVAAGRLDTSVQVRSRDEIGMLASVFNQMVEALRAADEAKQKHLEELNEVNVGLEERVRQRTLEISRMNAELWKANRLKGEFLANISHELRTPLNAIIGFSGALLSECDGPITADQRESCQFIERSGKHLLEIVNDILDMSKLQAGRFDLHLAQVDLPSVIKDVLQTFSSAAREKGLVLTMHETAVPVVSADAMRIKQVLLNLVSNAVKFTQQGGVVVSCKEIDGDVDGVPPGVEKKLREIPGPWVICSVADTGIGVAEGDRELVFEEFRQAGGGPGGTGLGLAISRRFIELHGGALWLESVAGEGSAFFFALPVSRAPQMGLERSPLYADESATSGSIAAIAELGRIKIAIIDDDPICIELVRNLLDSERFDVHVAKTGSDGISLCRRIVPALLVLDLRLPDADGAEILSVLGDDPTLSKVPVLVLTAVALSGVEQKALGEQVRFVMQKGSFSGEAFVREIDRLVYTVANGTDYGGL